MRTALKSLALLVVLLLPAPVFAQASLTGTVRDGSGGVLPGVTVEASSPALIQKTRTAVTDGTGQFLIEPTPCPFSHPDWGCGKSVRSTRPATLRASLWTSTSALRAGSV